MEHVIAIPATVNQQPNQQARVIAKPAVHAAAIIAAANQTPAIVMQQSAAR